MSFNFRVERFGALRWRRHRDTQRDSIAESPQPGAARDLLARGDQRRLRARSLSDAPSGERMPANPARPVRVFISHTTRDQRDRALAHYIAAGLEARGARVWIAPESIPPG